ncbi:MAG: shikimate dehydrogenase [Alphaproteobacteria bacterium]|nr:shikimate dehydrogenase [Alphaproteobacteria bacterium]
MSSSSEKPELAAVLGWPVSHSLSPKLHNYWLNQNNINGQYVAVGVRPERLEEVIKSIPERGWRGCNLTIPHKEKVIPLLDEVSDVARAIGAVNTIIVKEGGKLYGTNTDAYGFAENIRPKLKGRKKAVVLGAGGAARAIWQALTDLDFEEVVIANRTASRAQQAHKSGVTQFAVCPWDERNAALAGTDLLVNTTSLGMEGQDALEISLKALPKTALVTDIVYTPLMTPLLESAQSRGNAVVDGLGMLIHQAVPGFEAWFGVKPTFMEELKPYLLA